MERLIINISEEKSTLVKKILKELGATIQQEKKKFNPSTYRKKIASVSIWSEEDIKQFDESKKAFKDLKPQKW